MSTQRITDVPMSNGVSSVFVNDENKLRQVPFGDFSSLFNFAPTIINEKSGESIIATDSSNDRFRGMNVYGKSTQRTTTGKNLLNCSGLSAQTINGVTFTPVYESNGILEYINVNGTATSNTTYELVTFSVFDVGTFKAVGTPSGGEREKYCIELNTPTVTGMNKYTFEIGNGAEITIKEIGIPNFVCRIRVNAGVSASNLRFKPMITKDLTATYDDYEPYTDGPSPNPEYPQEIENCENTEVSVYGKNLLPYPYYNGSQSNNGAVMTILDDGGIVCSGTPTDYIGITLLKTQLNFAKNFTARLLGDAKNVTLDINIYDENDDSLLFSNGVGGNNSIFVDVENYSKEYWMYLTLKRQSSNVTMSGTAYPIIVSGNVEPTEYEPYKEKQSLTIPNTLCGIPVSSGGNYTDDKGQEWVCDEIDMERGVYVQRVGRITLNGSQLFHQTTVQYLFYMDLFDAKRYKTNSIITWLPVLCERYIDRCKGYDTITDGELSLYNANTDDNWEKNWLYLSDSNFASADSVKEYFTNNPTKVQYILATPIETPLTAEQIAAYKALHSNYPTTTIWNNNGAGMMVKYGADTKLYIDNKFAELAVQLV